MIPYGRQDINEADIDAVVEVINFFSERTFKKLFCNS